MHKQLIAFFVLGALALASEACSSSPAEPSRGRPAVATVDRAGAGQPERVLLANDALRRARGLVASSRADIGVSAGEIARATLGSEIASYSLTSEELRAYAAGDDPRALLGEPREMIEPILVDGVARAAVVLGRGDGGAWRVIGLGRPGLARSLQGIDHGSLPTELVSARELDLRMAAREDGGSLMLTPLSDVSEAGLAAGKPVIAQDAFQRLAPLAQRRIALRTSR
jgi:hypothetical protein